MISGGARQNISNDSATNEHKAKVDALKRALLARHKAHGLSEEHLINFTVKETDGWHQGAHIFLADKLFDNSLLPPEAVIEEMNNLEFWQAFAIKENYEMGLRASHLRAWKQGDLIENFSMPCKDVLTWLICEKSCSPELAVNLLNNPPPAGTDALKQLVLRRLKHRNDTAMRNSMGFKLFGDDKDESKVKIADVNRYMSLAWEAIMYTHEVLSSGSINKASDQTKLEYQRLIDELDESRKEQAKFLSQFHNGRFFIESRQDPLMIQKICSLATICKKYKVGNCSEQTIVAFDYLINTLKLDNVDFCHMDYGDHFFLLINGNIICDPWDNDVYHVNDFEKKKKSAAHLKYADYIYDETPDVKPFLYGIPTILASTGISNIPAIVEGEFVRDNAEKYASNDNDAILASGLRTH